MANKQKKNVGVYELQGLGITEIFVNGDHTYSFYFYH